MFAKILQFYAQKSMYVTISKHVKINFRGGGGGVRRPEQGKILVPLPLDV